MQYETNKVALIFIQKNIYISIKYIYLLSNFKKENKNFFLKFSKYEIIIKKISTTASLVKEIVEYPTQIQTLNRASYPLRVLSHKHKGEKKSRKKSLHNVF